MKTKSKTSKSKPSKPKSKKLKLDDPKNWAIFAKKKKITNPFFVKDNVIRRTSDGKYYPTLHDYFADGGAIDGSNATHLK